MGDGSDLSPPQVSSVSLYGLVAIEAEQWWYQEVPRHAMTPRDKTAPATPPASARASTFTTSRLPLLQRRGLRRRLCAIHRQPTPVPTWNQTNSLPNHWRESIQSPFLVLFGRSLPPPPQQRSSQSFLFQNSTSVVNARRYFFPIVRERE